MTLKTRLRHVDIHNHWLRQEVENGTINVVHTPTKDLVADGLTKSLARQPFEDFIKQLNLVKKETEPLREERDPLAETAWSGGIFEGGEE